MSNVYYSPEKWDLEVFGEIEFSDLDYVFDTQVVWKHSSGKLYTARSAGCSCPMPFEDFGSIDDLDEVTDFDQFEREVLDSYTVQYATTSEMQMYGLLSKVKRELHKPLCGKCKEPRPQEDYLCGDCRQVSA